MARIYRSITPDVPLPPIGSNPFPNARNSPREISNNNREHETQNYSGGRFQEYLSSEQPGHFIEQSRYQLI